MTFDSPLHAEHELADLAQRFAHWRAHRISTAEPIPEPLWDQAVALTAVLPRSRVAKRLRLSGRMMKQRCAAQQGTTVDAVSAAPLDFVELSTPPAWTPMQKTVEEPPRPTPSVEVELQRADGARLRLHYHELPPLEAVVRVFLEARR
jgi:hypothetical protein